MFPLVFSLWVLRKQFKRNAFKNASAGGFNLYLQNFTSPKGTHYQKVNTSISEKCEHVNSNNVLWWAAIEHTFCTTQLFYDITLCYCYISVRLECMQKICFHKILMKFSGWHLPISLICISFYFKGKIIAILWIWK